MSIVHRFSLEDETVAMSSSICEDDDIFIFLLLKAPPITVFPLLQSTIEYTTSPMHIAATSPKLEQRRDLMLLSFVLLLLLLLLLLLWLDTDNMLVVWSRKKGPLVVSLLAAQKAGVQRGMPGRIADRCSLFFVPFQIGPGQLPAARFLDFFVERTRSEIEGRSRPKTGRSPCIEYVRVAAVIGGERRTKDRKNCNAPPPTVKTNH